MDDTTSNTTVRTTIALVFVMLVTAGVIGALASTERPPTLLVEEVSPTEITVADGNTFDVEATIRNTANTTERKPVILSINGYEWERQTVRVGPGNAVTVRFADVDPSGAGAGEHNFSISTPDDSMTGALNILPAAAAGFAITELTAEPATLTPSDTLTVEAVIENTGEVGAEQELVLDIGDETVATTELSLAAGATETVTFTDAEPSDRTARLTTVRLTTADDVSETDLVVEDDRPGAIEVMRLEPGNVTAETGVLNVSVELANTGGATVQEGVEFRVDGTEWSNLTIELPPGESTNLTFYNVGLAYLAGEEVTYGVYTESDEATATVFVPETLVTDDSAGEGDLDGESNETDLDEEPGESDTDDDSDENGSDDGAEEDDSDDNND